MKVVPGERWTRRVGVMTTLGLAAGMTGVVAAADLTNVPSANPKTPGFAAANVLSPELSESPVAQGSLPLENGTATIPYYGYDGNGPMVPLAGDVQAPGHNVEASKTEPDKNTYLVLHGQHGSDPDYDYGQHFLFQGHETGVQGYITRINLDADGPHRLTLFASTDDNGAALPVFDGSTWDPFAQRLLFTAELAANGGVWTSTLDFPPTVHDAAAAFGRGGYEGIQNDSDGNLWIVEDVGGKAGTVNTHAKQPNSFLYRFVPKNPRDLTRGRLQALQVASLSHPGRAITFHAGQADADIRSDDVRDLHTYGKVFATRWVTIHDTDTDPSGLPFDANALAKAAGATPFKRPENGLFRPTSGFREFFFDETGDTNAQTEAGQQFGGFGGILKLTQASPSADTGLLTLFYLGDVAHNGFDNVAWWSSHEVVFVEDAGDGLHTQRNALDSAYLFDVTLNYANPANQPLRILAEGRDPSATIDSSLGSVSGNGFQNEGDNEITGIHVSDGDPTPSGILGAKAPRPFRLFSGWRVFYTQQHGDNFTWEITRPRPPFGALDND